MIGSVVIITPPATPPVSLAEVKKHCRAVDFADDDAYLESLIAAAVSHIDGPAGGWLGRALVTQTLELRLDRFCDTISLPFPPSASVTSVKYDDADGDEQTLAGSSYRFIGQPDAPRVVRAFQASWPRTRCQAEAIRVRWAAGYGAAADVPAAIRHAMLLLIGHWYESREAVVVGQTVTALPMAVDALLAPYRVYR